METVFWVSYALLWIVVAVQGFAFLELMRQAAQLREALQVYQGPSEQKEVYHVGEQLPPSAAQEALTGAPVRWNERLAGDLGVLVVLHPGCVTCHGVAQGLPALLSNLQNGISVVPVVEGRNLEVARAFMRELSLDAATTVLDEEPSLARVLNVSVKPAAVVLFEGRVESAHTIRSATQLEILIRDSQARLRARLAGRGDGVPAVAAVHTTV